MKTEKEIKYRIRGIESQIKELESILEDEDLTEVDIVDCREYIYDLNMAIKELKWVLGEKKFLT